MGHNINTFGITAVTAVKAAGFTQGIIKYEFASNVFYGPYSVIVTGVTNYPEIGINWNGTLSIPDTVTYDNYKYSVVAIGTRAFQNSPVIRFILPNTISTIDDYAFYNSYNLVEVNVPNSVTSIESGAFSYCTKLTSVQLGSIPYITWYTFYNCSSLTDITIPSTVTSIGAYAFSGCSSLKNINMPDKLAGIGTEAFKGCNKIKDLYIPKSVVSLAGDALTIGGNIIVDQNNLYYSSLDGVLYSFDGTKLLQCPTEKTGIFEIPTNVTSISGFAFDGCTKITNIDFPYTLTEIKYNAFIGCTGLTSLNIPTTITSIGEYAFTGCSGLKSIYASSINPISIGSSTFDLSTKSSCKLYVHANSQSLYRAANCWKDFSYINEFNPKLNTSFTDLTTGLVYMVTDVTTLRVKGYNSMNSILTIPSNVSYDEVDYTVTSIGGLAFKDLTGIQRVTIPSSITSIGDSAFYNCSGLDSVYIPTSINRIPNYFFYGCSSLSGITIPGTVTSIGNAAFNGCSGLNSISLPTSLNSIGTNAFENCSGLNTITIPFSVSSVGNDAFKNCSGLTSATTRSTYNIFSNCSKLKTITVPANTPAIQENAFKDLNSLTSIFIPSSVTSIGNFAFSGCSSLNIFRMLNTVTSLGEGAFMNCSALSDVTLSDKLNTINTYTFKGCSSLSACSLPNSITSIGAHAFRECSGIKSMILPTSLTAVYDSAYADCSGLDSISIPESVNTLGFHAFDCRNLKAVYANAKNPVSPVSGNSIFGWVNYNNCVLHIFAGSVAKYQVARGWSEFSNIQAYNTAIDTDFELNGLLYHVTGLTTLKLTHISDNDSIIIPDIVTYDGADYTVTTIGSHVSNSWDSNVFKYLKMPNSITDIADEAFIELNFKTIILSQNIQQIGSKVFRNCRQLQSVTIPQGVKTIADEAFYNCCSIIHLSLPSTLTTIGNGAFQYCSAWNDSVVIPNSVTSLGTYAFSGCTTLKNISLPISFTNIPDGTFQNCKGIKSYEINDNIKTIGAWAFSGNDINSIKLPKSLTTIGEYAFGSNQNLKCISIPDSVTSIGDRAFNNSSGLQSIFTHSIIPAEINNNTFDDNVKLNCKLVIPSGSLPRYSAASVWQDFAKMSEVNTNTDTEITINGINYRILSPTTLTVIAGDYKGDIIDGQYSGNITIPSTLDYYDSHFTVVAIDKEAFNWSLNIKNITLPESIISIGENAFHFSSLKSINIPNSVKTIAKDAFYQCIHLTSITLPESVTTLGDEAFIYCGALATVNLPKNLTSIGIGVFCYCSSLTTITIPESVTTIKDNAFNNSGIKSLKLPSGLTSIGSQAFEACNNLTNVEMPGTMNFIGGLAFSGCSNLMSFKVYIDSPIDISYKQVFNELDKTKCVLYVPMGSSILYHSANDWQDFTHIVEFNTLIGSTITANGTNYLITGDNSANVTTKLYNGNLTIPASFNYLGVDYSVKNIGNNAYKNSTGLYSISLPNTLDSIGVSAFNGCTNLTSISIPATVKAIGDSAFYNCSSLTSIYVSATTPLDITNLKVFDNVNKSTCSLYVPISAYGLYQNANGWKDFTNMLTYNPLIGDSILVNGIKYVISGTTQLTVIKGVYYKGNLTIPASLNYDNVNYRVVAVGNDAFKNCDSLTVINLPLSLKAIGDSAFSFCTRLIRVNLPDSVTIVGGNAFSDCTALKYLLSHPKTPANLTNLSAFTNVDKTICNLYVPVGSKDLYQNADGWKDFSNIFDPSTIGTVIPSDDYNYKITDVNTVAVAGNNLKYSGNILIPSFTSFFGTTYHVTGIDNDAFRNCLDLTGVTIPSSVTSINDNAFLDCDKLDSINVPDSVTYIGTNALKVNKAITVSVDNQNFISINGILYNKAQTTLMECPITKSGVFVVPEMVNTIGDGAFMNCHDLTGFQLPKGVKTIGNSAFEDCSNLVSFQIPDSVNNISNRAFNSCSSLTSITIPKKINSLGNETFQFCTKLTNIDLPDSISSIGWGLFNGCSFTDIKIPEKVTFIGYASFAGCNFTSFTIPKNVTFIDNVAFAYCSNLKTIYSYASVPPVISLDWFRYDPFAGLDKSGMTVYVPAASKTQYQNALGWQDFKNLEGAITLPSDYFRSLISGNASDIHSWESSADNNTWISSTLAPATDAASVTILNNDTITVDKNLIFSQLTLNAGSVLNINSDSHLTVKSSMTNNGKLILRSDATGTASILTPETINGTGITNVQQYLTSGRNWYTSSPVSGAMSAVFNAENPANIVYWYDEAHGSSTPWNQITNNTTNLTPMKGYVYNPAATGVITFSGSLNSGTQSIVVNRTVGQTKEGFNLIGNPFASYLDWSQVSRNNLSQSMWYRTKSAPAQGTGLTSYMFDTYNVLADIATTNGEKPMTKMIPPMQAFWVRVADGQTQATITTSNAHRGFNDITNNSFHVKAENGSAQPTLRLEVSNGTISDQTVVYINPNASNNYDEYDSQKMFNNSGSIAEIYTIAGKECLAINGLNSVNYDTEMSIGFTTVTAGTFSIKASQFSNFTAGTHVILKDNITQQLVDISDCSSYCFTSAATSNNTNRFALMFHVPSITTGINPATSENSWLSTTINGQLIINGIPADNTTLEVFNTVGQRILIKTLNQGNLQNKISLETGIYIVTLTQNGHKYTQKVYVNAN
ncbi:MAG: leucine-rich repeat protein [Paludibacter sp.]